MRGAEQFIESIVNSSRIPPGRKRREIVRELRSHIEDFVTAARASGRDETEIEHLIVAHFGDAGQIADCFAWVYRHERRSFQALIFAGSTTLLFISVFAAILTAQTGLAIVFGTPIMKVLASWHTVIEGLDILASVAAYLAVVSLEQRFETYRFQKAAAVATLFAPILIALCALAGLRTSFLVFGLVNGIFCRALQAFITRKVARAGVVALCFPLAGIIMSLLRSPAYQSGIAATCVSWFAMGICYQLMTYLAERLKRGLVTASGGFEPGS